MVEVKKKQNWGKYSTFNRSMFALLDVFAVNPMCNWGRKSKKGITVIRDVRYGEWPRAEGDIFYAGTNTDVKRPVFLQIHGGGFVGSCREAREALCLWYARLGFFVYNISYTLAPEGRFPQGVLDCMSAYNWIYDNAEKYNLDTDMIFVGGDSAGGYYTSAVGTICTSPELQQRYGVSVQGKPRALVLNCGLYDMRQVIKSKIIMNMGKTICDDLTGTSIDDIESYEYYNEISTLDYVTADYPPCYVVWAKKDMFCQGQGERFAAKLRDCGVYCEDYGGVRAVDNHVFPLFWSLRSAKESNAKLQQFFVRMLASSTEE